MGILEALLASVVPLLVQGAIGLFSDSGREEEKRSWVTGLAADLEPLIKKWDPTASAVLIADIENAVKIALNEALDKLEGANSADTTPPAGSSVPPTPAPAS